MFLDETSAYLNLSRSYGRAAKGERVVDDAPKGKKERASLLAAVTSQGLAGARCLVHPGNVNKAAFLSYLKTLLPELSAGSILVMDNWRVHLGPDVRNLVEKHRCSILYLPAYSPDFNPIEFLFGKIKAFVKLLRPLTLPELIQAFVDAVLRVTPDDAYNTFRHCGYVEQ